MEELVAVDDGARLWCTSSGAGPALVLCHGGPGMWDYLEPLAALVPGSMRTIRWDQRGCGRSDRVGPYAVGRTLADLEALRDHLGIDRWVVGGHSFGATLALHHALEHPERVRAVVYVSGVGIGRAWNLAYHERADRLLRDDQRARRDELAAIDRTAEEERELCAIAWTPDFADRSTAAAQAASMAAVPFLVNRVGNAAINAETKVWDEEDLTRRCRRLDVPVLIVHGREDPRPVWAVDSLAAALPHAEVHALAGAGHLPWVEAPEETAAVLATFLAEHDLTS